MQTFVGNSRKRRARATALATWRLLALLGAHALCFSVAAEAQESTPTVSTSDEVIHDDEAASAPPVEEPSAIPPQSAPLSASEPTRDPRIQENGDWERHSFAVHIPTGLRIAGPFGAIDGHAPLKLADNAGTFFDFELGVGVRVRRLVFDLMFSIGGASSAGPMRELIASDGFDPGGILRIFTGLDGAYYFKRTRWWAPWVGGRIGYEALIFGGGHEDDVSIDYTFSGLYAALRSGVDWRINAWVGLGPFFELGIGRFFSGEMSLEVEDDSLTSENEHREHTESLSLAGGGVHGYVGGGLRFVVFP